MGSLVKDVAVTGASGFIGGALAEVLHSRGYSVRGGYRRTRPAASYELVAGDLTDPEAAVKLVRGCDTVFHVAALVGTLVFKRSNAATIASDNVASTLNVLNACVRQGVRRLVFLSSTELYSGTGPFSEERGFEVLPDETNDGYVWSKRFGEIATGLYSRQHGLSSAILRVDNVYGPSEFASKQDLRAIPAMISRALMHEDLIVWGDGSQNRAFLYIDDLVEAIIASGSVAETLSPINIASSERITIADLGRLILQLTGSRGKLVTDLSKPIGAPARDIVTERAQRVLGFMPSFSLEQGISQCIDAFRKLNS